MADQAGSSKKFQWKWVVISLVMYIVLYVLVLLIMQGGVLSTEITARIWAVAGVFLIAAIAGYLSKGVTIWEIVIAAVIVSALLYIMSELGLTVAVPLGTGSKPVLTLLIIFVFSLLGAWLGERIQKSKSAKKAAE
ncbi:MAG: hypothetical protein ABSB78_00785 [Bacteroidota bacterium]